VQVIRCRICDSTLSVAHRSGGCGLDERVPGSAPVQIEDDGLGPYIRCPHCAARNVTIVTADMDGRQAVQVVWAVMNGD
jgi:hypothetical protein